MGKSAILGLMATVLAILGLAGPAAAAGPKAETVTVTNSGGVQITTHKLANGSVWAVAKITMKAPSASSRIHPMTESSCVYPTEGGEWCFGWNFKYVGTAEYKNCYSNYYNGTKTHYASVIIGGNYSGRYYASAGHWADSSFAAGLAYTCYSYYGTS